MLEIEQRVKIANKMFKEKNYQGAREIYLRETDNMMSIAEKTKDENPEYTALLKQKITLLLQQVKKCQNP